MAKEIPIWKSLQWRLRSVAIDHFADRLIEQCRRKGAPVCVGIDPVYERLPEPLRRDGSSQDQAHARVEAICHFVEGVLETVAGHVPCVKFQSACFERYLWPGVHACCRLMEDARRLGLVVIADAKRGDIGISAEHYAAGCLSGSSFGDLGPLTGPDALTISAYLGPDSLEPFINQAASRAKGLFALVRTSNPGARAIQSLTLENGRRVADAVAEMIARVADAPGLVGRHGYSLLGAVVGATDHEDAARLRKLMPRQILLVPGFGAQGGTADNVRACFDHEGRGAVITASRSILYAFEKQGGDWRQAIERATIEMKQQIQALI